MNARKFRLYQHLQLAAHSLQKSADRALLEAAGLTTAQAAVLAVIQASGPCRQRDVASQLGINESAMTAMINRLIGTGLVARSPDKADARAWQLGLTRQGGTALRKSASAFAAINQGLDEALGNQDPAQLAGTLVRIRARFSEAPLD